MDVSRFTLIGLCVTVLGLIFTAASRGKSQGLAATGMVICVAGFVLCLVGLIGTLA